MSEEMVAQFKTYSPLIRSKDSKLERGQRSGVDTIKHHT